MLFCTLKKNKIIALVESFFIENNAFVICFLWTLQGICSGRWKRLFIYLFILAGAEYHQLLAEYSNHH